MCSTVKPFDVWLQWDSAPYTPVVNGYKMQSKIIILISGLKIVTTLFQCNQFLIDRDGCSNIVGYFYDVAHG